MNVRRLFSLKFLLVLGFSVAIVPLLAAVLYAAMALRETAAMGRGMNRQVFEQTKAVRLALQKTADIERKARLFVLFADPALQQPYERKSYEAARASFKQALAELLKLPLDNTIALLANELSEKEGLIYQQIVSADPNKLPKLPDDEAFINFRDASSILSREFESHVDRQFSLLRQQSEASEQGLLTKASLLLGISVVLVGLLLAFVGRSLRQLETSIRSLGEGKLDVPILITGPSDLSELGGALESLRTRLQERAVNRSSRLNHALAERICANQDQETSHLDSESPLPQSVADEF